MYTRESHHAHEEKRKGESLYAVPCIVGIPVNGSCAGKRPLDTLEVRDPEWVESRFRCEDKGRAGDSDKIDGSGFRGAEISLARLGFPPIARPTKWT